MQVGCKACDLAKFEELKTGRSGILVKLMRKDMA
jgi:hypothetical protein